MPDKADLSGQAANQYCRQQFLCIVVVWVELTHPQACSDKNVGSNKRLLACFLAQQQHHTRPMSSCPISWGSSHVASESSASAQQSPSHEAPDAKAAKAATGERRILVFWLSTSNDLQIFIFSRKEAKLATQERRSRSMEGRYRSNRWSLCSGCAIQYSKGWNRYSGSSARIYTCIVMAKLACADENWDFPSPQRFYNALKKKVHV